MVCMSPSSTTKIIEELANSYNKDVLLWTRCNRDMCLHFSFRMAHIKNEINFKFDLGRRLVKKFTSEGTLLLSSNQTAFQVIFQSLNFCLVKLS